MTVCRELLNARLDHPWRLVRRLLFLLLTVLPLQWFVLLGPLRLHIVAIYAFTVIGLVAIPARDLLAGWRTAWLFVLANAVILLIWVTADVLHGIGVNAPLQQAVFLGCFLVTAAVIATGLQAPDGRLVRSLRWVVLATVLTTVGALAFSMARNGVNVVEVFRRTVASGDPNVLQRELFRSAFGGFGFEASDARSNFRHEVFGSVLLAMTVSSACVQLRPFTARWHRNVYRGAMVAGTLMLIVSLSRSVMIAAILWPLLGLLRDLMSGRLRPRTVGLAALIAIGAAVLSVAGLLQIVWVRFTQDTTSYQKRDDLLAEALRHLRRAAFSGGVDTQSASSHNLVLDTWLRAGVVAALAALVVVVLLSGLFISLAVTLPAEPSWMLPVTVMLGLPVVRVFTAGGGLITPVSWVALGAVCGFIAYRNAVKGADEEATAPVKHLVVADR